MILNYVSVKLSLQHKQEVFRFQLQYVKELGICHSFPTTRKKKLNK